MEPKNLDLDKFAVLILTHARPDRVKTYPTLRKSGYTGKIYLVLDNLDETRAEYERLYPGEVIVFDKAYYAGETDSGDNFGTMKGVIYARNAVHDLARDLGLEHFLVLDDDYTVFTYKFGPYGYVSYKKTFQIEKVFAAILKFLDESGANSVALAQGGDFIGGEKGSFAKSIRLRRKCMNSFFCRTDRPFKFLGRINEDATMYVDEGVRGKLYFTINQFSLNQTDTQQNPGGLTEIYLEAGTYVKSFYTVMYRPGSCKVKLMGNVHKRLHHSINWNATTPKILREEIKKTRN